MNIEERLQQDRYEGEDAALFYGHAHTEWPYFSNFSRHPVTLLNPWTGGPLTYKTGEHRYQAMKADNVTEHDWVAEAPGPGASKDRGRQVDLRLGWGDDYGDLGWYVMFENVLAKALQNPQVLRSLKSTGTRPIYEDSPTDDIWGWRYAQDYRGKNLLGRCWMDVRAVVTGL